MINYKPLFKTMSKKQISSYALFKKTFPNQLIIQYNRETALVQTQLTSFVDYQSALSLTFLNIKMKKNNKTIHNLRGIFMISYNPLFRTMKEKNISSYKLLKRGFSRSTYYAIKHGKGITTNTIDQLCKLLQCEVPDIIEYIEIN